MTLSVIITAQPQQLPQEQSVKVLQEQIAQEQDPSKRLESMLVLANNMLTSGKVADADNIAEAAARYAISIGDKNAQADAFDLRGEACQARFDFTNAYMWYTDAQKLREIAQNQRGLARSEYQLGQVLHKQHEQEKALQHAQQALRLFTDAGNISGIAKARQLLGEIYLEQQVFGSAQEHLKAAIDANVQLGNHTSAAGLASQLGTFAMQVGDHEGALVYHRQAFDLHVSNEDKAGMIRDFLAMGDVLSATHQAGEARAQFEAALAYSQEERDTICQVKARLALGRLTGDQTEYQFAAQLLRHAALTTETPSIWIALGTAFERKGNFTEAYQALTRANQAREILNQAEKSQKLLELDMLYQSQLAETTRRRTIERLELEQKSATRIRWGLMLIVGLAVLALWSLWQQYRTKKRDHALLLNKNKEIEHANARLEDLNNALDETNQLLVSEIAEREMLQTSVFEKDKFLASVSREMKEPLQQIIKSTAQLSEGGMKQMSMEELNEMQFSANNLLVFINDMLEHNQIETGKLQLESTTFDPAMIFNDLRQRFAQQYRAQGLTFRMEYDSAIPTRLNGDPVHLNHIITKLLQHLPVVQDTNHVLLSVVHGERTTDSLSLQIKLTGLETALLALSAPPSGQEESDFAPSDAEQRNRIFSLSMVKRLIGFHEGQLFTTPNEINITLPFRPESAGIQRNTLTKDTIISVINRKRILVVEDNKINQLIVSNLLKAHGADVITADNGEDAIHSLQKHTIDLVLMDIQMPKLDGYRTTAHIRKMERPEKAHVPIVALTASAYLTDKDKAELFKMDDHIGKPFSPEELLQKIVKIFHTETTSKRNA